MHVFLTEWNSPVLWQGSKTSGLHKGEGMLAQTFGRFVARSGGKGEGLVRTVGLGKNAGYRLLIVFL